MLHEAFNKPKVCFAYEKAVCAAYLFTFPWRLVLENCVKRRGSREGSE